MTKIEDLTEHHAALRSELTGIEGRLRRMDVDEHIKALHAEVDAATRSGEEEAITGAIQRLQEARNGSDGFCLERDRLEGKVRVLTGQIEEAKQAIDTYQREQRELRRDLAAQALVKVRSEYEKHARALLELYPALNAAAVVHAEARQACGVQAGMTDIVLFSSPNNIGVSLPVAGGAGLPPELAGGVTYFPAEYNAALEAARAGLEQQFNDANSDCAESAAA